MAATKLPPGLAKALSLFAGINISNKAENAPFIAYLAGMTSNLCNTSGNYLQLDITVFMSDNVKY